MKCDPRQYTQYLPLKSVTARMPPTFLYHTTGDKLVPAMGSLRFYEALQAKLREVLETRSGQASAG